MVEMDEHTVEEDKISTKHDDDYRFLDYRLNQLENSISRGLEKLEREQANSQNKESQQEEK